ncbi:DUF1565 domain-containing protein [Archangium violaceum]|uniref:DUF1565 domain-containing protein n=1 Tax=Archangium violaceum TaxID=83451 RepID=UPI0019508778|nr:DUF1565 domain-containing protein [Archangium violaceum]QRN95951.1 DUF1565 domain-containing protein [Archangium violaceum]
MAFAGVLSACDVPADVGVSETESPSTQAQAQTESFYKAINLAGSAVTVEGRTFSSFAEAKTQGLSIPSGYMEAQSSYTASPQVDSATGAMLNSGIWQSGTLKLAQTLPSARYNVYLYILENYQSQYRSLTLSLEGQQVAQGLGALQKAEWKKYGPYTVQVSDGALNLDLSASAGDPHLMGLALYSVGANPEPIPGARTYYVSLSGNDSTGDGSQARPYRTIAKAAEVVPANGGHTIQVGAGTFDETAQIRLKERVNLIGAGQEFTVIRGGRFDWNANGLIQLESRVPHPSGEKIPAFVHEDGKTYGPFDRYVSVDSPQELAYFSMEGQNLASSGIKLVNRNHVKIHHVKIKDYTWAGILSESAGYAEVKDLQISNFLIAESSKEDTGSSWGNITLRGTHEGLLIQDGRIEHLTNPTRPEGYFKGSGYAIKAFRSWEDTARKQDELRSSRILNIVQRGKDSAPWANYTAANIAFEFWSIGADGVEIANCDLNAALSLEYNAAIDQNPYSFYVHHNRIKTVKSGLVELANSNIIVDSNSFDLTGNANPWNVMGEYNNGGPSNQGPVLKNIRVSNNVFNLASFSPAMFVFTTRVENFKFYNNTVISSGAPALFEFRRPSSQGSGAIDIRNNIFESGSAMKMFVFTENNNGTAPSSVAYTNNLHKAAPVNLPATTTQAGNILGTAQLARTGAMPFPYFEASSASSNVVDRGVNVGLPFTGSAPDIGASEYGRPAGTIGTP